MTTAVAAPLTTFTDSQTHLLAGLACVDLRVRWAVARARANGLNPDDEFRGLYVADTHVDALLGYDIGAHLWQTANGLNGHTPADWQQWADTVAQSRANWQTQTEASRQTAINLRLDALSQTFSLSEREVDILLIALAPELDPRYERLFAYLQDDVTRKRPSVDLILNLLTDSFTDKLTLRQRFSENNALRRNRLIQLHGDAHTPLLAQFVRPAPHLIEFLLGQDGLDGRLTGTAQLHPVSQTSAPHRLDPDFAQRLIEQSQAAAPPLHIFVGGYGVGKMEAARLIAQARAAPLLAVDGRKLNDDADLLPLAARDGRLHQAILYLHHADAVLADGRFPDHLLQPLLDYPLPAIIAGKTGWPPRLARTRPIFTVTFESADYGRRLRHWQTILSQPQPDQPVDLRPLANQFRFTPGQIEDAAASAHDLAQWQQTPLAAEHLFAASRAHSNQKLTELATKIRPRYGWDDIVLPPDTRSQLREMVNTVRQRPVVYGDWGFGRKVALGKGLNALFAGESGTGKTMAADVMARELGLDLYKIDLSTVVSKYIG